MRRRLFVSALCAAGATLVIPVRADAAALAVVAPTRAAGAVVSAVGGASVNVTVDPQLDVGELRIGGTAVPVGQRLLFKGEGDARRRFLDDARNALKYAANVRDALGKADPSHAAAYRERHAAWSRPFARKVLQWQERLNASKLHGQRVREAAGRVYLLEWAGVAVDSKASTGAPNALSTLPADAQAATPPSYEAYINSLVAVF